MDVLVVGAGPTGLTLATELQAYGVPFRIIDRQLDRVHESRALAIQPRTLEVLARHGLAQPLVDLGTTAVRLRLHADGRVIPIDVFDVGLSDTAYPFLLFLSQAETERVLCEHLDRHGVTVERGVELVGLDQDGDQVTCRLRHRDGREETVQASYVSGCDGAHSTVRQQAGIGFAGRAYPQTFVLADLEVDGLEPGAVHSYLTGAGLLFFFPLGTPATWRMLAIRPAGTTGEVTLAELQAIVDRTATDGLRLRDPVWMTDFRLHLRGAERYRSGRVFLAGDAAHIHSPAGGQGMNTGIQDAVNLGWKLALDLRGIANPRAAGHLPGRARPGRAGGAAPHRPAVHARHHHQPTGAPGPYPARAVRGADRVAVRPGPGRGLPYPVPAGRPVPAQPTVGRRSAGRELRDPRGGTHARRAVPHHARLPLLLCGRAEAWPADAAAGLPDLVTVHRVDDRQVAHYLVRPDGYVGYRAGGTDLSRLRGYLSRWLPGLAPRPG